jgi:hypothetical protein
MIKSTATRERVETTGDHKLTGTGVEIGRTPTPVVIGATTDLRAGSVLINSGTRLPESVYFESKQFGSWKILTEVDGFAVERRLSETGWHFFFMVPEIRLGAMSSNLNKALRAALKKVFSAVEVQNFNALEIVEITTKRFLGLRYVTIVAHPRHIKKSPLLRDLDPHYVPRNLWNCKGMFRRRAQIWPTRKRI